MNGSQTCGPLGLGSHWEIISCWWTDCPDNCLHWCRINTQFYTHRNGNIHHWTSHTTMTGTMDDQTGQRTMSRGCASVTYSTSYSSPQPRLLLLPSLQLPLLNLLSPSLFLSRLNPIISTNLSHHRLFHLPQYWLHGFLTVTVTSEIDQSFSFKNFFSVTFFNFWHNARNYADFYVEF